MTDKKKNGWIKFVPSLDLPKERVSIAYDTHDERGVRYAYGYFQFYNGTCGCFWKDGNDQPKVVKAEDIKYWMPIPSLDIQEEPVSEDLEKAAINYMKTENPPIWGLYDGFIAGAKWHKHHMEVNRIKHCNSISKEQAELEQKFLDEHLDKNDRMPTFLDAIEYGMRLQKEQMMKGAIDGIARPDDRELWCNLDSFNLKDGNKVKVIVIKED